MDIDFNLIEKDVFPNTSYYIIYSNSCQMCRILLKYLPYMKTKFKLINAFEIKDIIPDLNINNIKVPLVINSNGEKVSIYSLIDYLITHMNSY